MRVNAPASACVRTPHSSPQRNHLKSMFADPLKRRRPQQMSMSFGPSTIPGFASSALRQTIGANWNTSHLRKTRQDRSAAPAQRVAHPESPKPRMFKYVRLPESVRSTYPAARTEVEDERIRVKTGEEATLICATRTGRE